MDVHTCTVGAVKICLKGVHGSAPGAEKVNGKNPQGKGMNPDSVLEEVS
jgi:hypothetical protein